MTTTDFSEDFLFATDHFPNDFAFDFEPYLYNSPQFLELSATSPSTFYILQPKKKKVLARCHFFIIDTAAFSSYRSPFGGMEMHERLSLDLISKFIAFIEKALKSKGVKTIRITQSPFVYSPGSTSKITNSYLRAGYQITHPDLNHHISINNQGFGQKIYPMERRKLKKALEKEFVFMEESIDALEKVYAFIQLCRKEKQQNLNIALADLHNAMEAMPESYKIFIVKEGDELIAASIIVLVNKRIAYNFLPASLSTHNKWSPMVFLLNHIYEWCQVKSIEIFDLGISSVGNTPQSSLIQFKERMGGEAGLKCTFYKAIG